MPHCCMCRPRRKNAEEKGMDEEGGEETLATPEMMAIELDRASTHDERSAALLALLRHTGVPGLAEMVGLCTESDSGVRPEYRATIFTLDRKVHERVVNMLLIRSEEGKELAAGRGLVRGAEAASPVL